MNFINIQWSEFVIGKIFKVSRGKRLIEKDRVKGNIPYFSASATNNGLTDFIQNPLFIEQDSIIITTFCDSYFVKGEFTASDEISILKNEYLSEYSGKFIARMITSNREKFTFGYKAFTERIKRQIIQLPATSKGLPDYAFMEQYMRHKEQENIKKFTNYIAKRIEQVQDFKEVKPLNQKEWGEFFIEDIFNIRAGKRLTKADMHKGKTPFIGASDSNNGITNFVSNTNSSLDSNVLGVNYNGSVVENFYHPYKAIYSDDVKRLSLKKVKGNEFLYLFIKTMILKQKSKFQYAYKFNETRMLRQKLLFPIDKNGQIDYDYMENYIKKIEHEKLNQYLEHKISKIND
jgi:hypothetical protein